MVRNQERKDFEMLDFLIVHFDIGKNKMWEYIEQNTNFF